MAYIRRSRTVSGRRRRYVRKSRPMMYRRFYRRSLATHKQFAVKRWVTRIVQNGDDTNYTGSANVTFSLDNLPGSGDLTNLFDAYKITGIKYRFLINRNPDFNTTAANKGRFVRINHVVDHTDTNSFTLSDLQQMPDMKEAWLADSNHMTRWFYFKPNTLDVGYTGLAISNYSQQYNRWISTTDPSAVYYGVKVLWDALYAGNQLQMEAIYYVKCKQQK